MHQINKVFLHYKLSHLGPGDDSMTQMIVTSYLDSYFDEMAILKETNHGLAVRRKSSSCIADNSIMRLHVLPLK
jgi:hypothetical protein